MSFIDHYIGEDTVNSIFVKVDERFRNEWTIPYDRVELALENEINKHWNFMPMNQRMRGGLHGLVQRGPGEMNDVVRAFAKIEKRLNGTM
jgi:hypothetical protein